jgi:ketosteroid isomerase-like protein
VTVTSPSLRDAVRDFVRLLETGEVLLAMERYYADDVAVFENRELSRAGREACIRHEKDLLAKLGGPPRIRFARTAVDEEEGVAFLEYVLRFTDPKGRPMRLEEVAVQSWERGRIVEERFYYEGFVDEGD